MPRAGGSARHSAQRGDRAGSRLIRAAAFTAGVPPALGMDPFPGKLLEVGEEESMGSGSLGEPGEAAPGGTKGTKPRVPVAFPT